MKNNWLKITYILALFCLCYCTNEKRKGSNKGKKKDNSATTLIKPPQFNADSAYANVEKQLNFGHRVPNTRVHTECGNWLVSIFKKRNLNVIEQTFESTAYDGTKLYLRNIIGSYKPELKKRILLMAHWDTRHIADKDSINKEKPILGANDGASGVAVILEIARLITSDNTFKHGIDFILFDGEDYGAPISYKEPISIPHGGYCLGSEYWANNMHKDNYSAYYGILVDMVGGKGAQFAIEGYSRKYAPLIVDRVWTMAEKLGRNNFFINENVAVVTDDHLPVNTIAKIPSIDIIEYKPDDGYFFADYHHTHNDNLNIIDKTTLDAVGTVLMYTLYNEK